MDECFIILLFFNFPQDLRQDSREYFKYDKPTCTEPFALTPKQSLSKVQLVAFGLKQDFPRYDLENLTNFSLTFDRDFLSLTRIFQVLTEFSS